MKTSFLRLLLLVGLTSYGRNAAAQAPITHYAALPLDSATQLVTYTAVIPAPGASQAELTKRAHSWAARFFQNSQLAVQLDDPATGTYVTRGSVSLPNHTHYTFLLSLYTKDGRYKYVLDQLHYAYTVTSGLVVIRSVNEPAEQWATRSPYYAAKRMRELEPVVTTVIKDLTAAMATTTATASSEW